MTDDSVSNARAVLRRALGDEDGWQVSDSTRRGPHGRWWGREG
jgi:hypothetical protein